MKSSELMAIIARGINCIVAALIIAALYFGQDVIIPIVLGALFCFLLTPFVNLLERWKLGRIGAVLVTTGLALGAGVLLFYVVGGQLLDVANKLPSYKENIRKKIASLHTSNDGPWSRLTTTFSELKREFSKEGSIPGEPSVPATDTDTPANPLKPTPPANTPETGPASSEKLGTPAKPLAKPVEVEVVNQGNLAEIASKVASPVLGPLGTAMVVIVFVIFMLLEKEDLRNRLIHLMGRSQISLTTRTLGEAGKRVRRYLLMQCVVNLTYGIPIGIGLLILGIPNALLWGLLTAVLRFIPYIGPWIGAFFPLALSLAVSDSWMLPILTVTLFVVVELISNNVVEPWLYGSSTGLSPVAILIAAIFWTSLWGVVGLLLATPITACLAVLGKYVPSLSFLDVLLGDQPALPAPDRYYQRLLARDDTEAAHIIVEYEKTRSFDQALVDLMAAAVMSAEREAAEGTLDQESYAHVLAVVRKHALRRLESAPAKAALDAAPAPIGEKDDTTPPDVLIIPAEDEGDEVIGVILGELLGEKIRTRVTSHKVLTNEKADAALRSGAPVICISDTSHTDAARARFLGRRLRTLQAPSFIVTGLWSLSDDETNLTTLAEKFGADQAATNLLVARDALRAWVVQPTLPATVEK